MSDGTRHISLELEYWTDFVGTFDPTKVLSRLAKTFPNVVIDATDHQETRLLRELEYWNAQEMTDERRQGFIRSSKRLYRDAGPTFSFQMPIGLERPVTGYARRYSIQFDVPSATPQEVIDAIMNFLRSLQMGVPELEID